MPLVQFLERQRENREVRDTYGVALAALAVSILALIAAGAPIPSLAVLFAVVLRWWRSLSPCGFPACPGDHS